jgi:hypothetical protein
MAPGAQMYTRLSYEGPYAVPEIKRELAALLKRDGFASVAEAVGADAKAPARPPARPPTNTPLHPPEGRG